MKYKVTWIKSAGDRLAELWMGSRRASQITAAADLFDMVLAEKPLEVGESRVAGFRIAFHSPLAINFVVDEPARHIYVLHVWTF